MNKFAQANQKIADTVAQGMKKIEDGVVKGYKGIENGVVGGFTRMTDKVVEQFLTWEGESVEDAKARIENQQAQIRAQIEMAQELGKASMPAIKINK